MSVYHLPISEHESVLSAALHVIQATHYGRESDPHADAAQEYAEEQLALAARALTQAVDRKPADKQPIGWAKDTEVEPQAIHTHFGLSYANYMVLPRTLLQSMPDAWQARFVALVDELAEAFQHVPQAEAYEVTAGTEHLVCELNEAERKQAGIVADWYRGEEPPEGLSAEDLAEWRFEHEDPEGPTFSKDGREVNGEELVLLPCADPVPHYNRGRTRIEPRLGGGE